jgi:hypothetical protein
MTTCKFYGNRLLFTAARQLFVLLLLVIAVHGQEREKKSLAILRTEDDGDPPVEPTNLNFLTVRLREIAGNILQNRYDIMTEQTIVNKLGKDNARSVCKEAASCLAKVGQSIEADYIGQARLGRFGGNLAITVQLYNSASGFEASPSITGTAKDIDGLLAVLNEKAPGMFRKMPGVSGGKASSPSFEGIGGVQTAGGGYEFDGGKSYLVNLSTEPAGAIMSFDGVPSASCAKTPCKAELGEGSVRIIAALEQYETADTTVSIKQNNQSINIRLKANFGILEIKPAYLDGIGKDVPWNLTINDKPYSLGEIKFSPNKYSVRLSHECYENIAFEAGINRDKREVFDMPKHIALKKGGLVLNAERDGEPVSEPVFVNGKQVGETPFSGSVPVCAKIKIGAGKEDVNVKIKHNESVKYTHKMNTEARKRRLAAEQQAREEAEEREQERQERERKEQENHAFLIKPHYAIIGAGWSWMMDYINPKYRGDGGFFYLGSEFVSVADGHLRFGGDFDVGMTRIEESEVYWWRSGALAKLYFFGTWSPYLTAGAGWYRDWNEYEGTEIESFSGPSFSVGVGLDILFFVGDARYFVMPTNGRNAGYIALNVGVSLGKLINTPKKLKL